MASVDGHTVCRKRENVDDEAKIEKRKIYGRANDHDGFRKTRNRTCLSNDDGTDDGGGGGERNDA